MRIFLFLLFFATQAALAGGFYGSANQNNAIPFINSVAAGLIPNANLITLFGYSPNTGSVTNVNVWELQTAWTLRATAGTMELLSDSANDNIAGTGCRLVATAGLDANFNQIAETTIPNGLTPVALVNSYEVINTSTCVVTGSGKVNAGNITTRATGAGATEAYIGIGAGASHHGRYTVPAGYSLVLENFFIQANKIGATNASSTITAMFILPTGVLIQGLPETVANSVNPTITVPTGVIVDEKQTLEFIINTVSVTGLNIGVGSSGVLIKKPNP